MAFVFEPIYIDPRSKYLNALYQARLAEEEYLQAQEQARLRRIVSRRAQEQANSRALAIAAARRLLAEEEEKTRRAQAEEQELAFLTRRIEQQRQQRIFAERRVQQQASDLVHLLAKLTISQSNALKALKAEPKPERVQPQQTSLKEQLESRLYSDESAEIRDTIHAILASLADAKSTPSSSGKGKARAEPSTEPSSPTARDLAHAFDVVKSIATAFTSLENEFVFPSKLDLDSESSTTAKLAFTANNHPVKYFEQSLTGLLLQLDQVDSFGNDQLRSLRKDIVGRVEKAIEDLEREVEGRWRTKQRKEKKAAEESSSETAQSASEAQPAAEESSSNTEPQPQPQESQPTTTQSVKVAESIELISQSADAEPQPVDTEFSQPVDTESSQPAETESIEPQAESVDTESLQQAQTESIEPQAEPVDTESAQTETSIPTEPSTKESQVVSPQPIYPPSIPYDIQSTEPVSSDDESASEIDTFLQPATRVQETKKDDVDSDWSEVDA